MEPIVSFVILHYRDIKSTDACVRSILQMDGRQYIRIVIVDNDIQATEEERSRLAERYKKHPAVTVVFVRENGGFSYGNNQGYGFARERQKASFIIVTNNDIVFPQRNFVDLMINCYRKNRCHVMGPDIVQPHTGIHQNPMAERVRTAEEAAYTIRMNRKALKYYSVLYPLLYWKIRRQEKKERSSEDSGQCRSIQKNKVLFGACLIFTPDFVMKEDKAFWPETKFFYEEYILTRRCLNHGYTTIYEPGLQVLHESGAATRYSYRNEKERLRFRMERMAEACEVYLGFIK